LLGNLNKARLTQESHPDCQRESKEPLIRANVAGGSLASDVLLASRQSQDETPFAIAVDGFTTDATRELL
jgi:hypothetical protein